MYGILIRNSVYGSAGPDPNPNPMKYLWIQNTAFIYQEMGFRGYVSIFEGPPSPHSW